MVKLNDKKANLKPFDYQLEIRKIAQRESDPKIREIYENNSRYFVLSNRKARS